jgi:transglutaminase-like putative cysteine protease
MTRRAFRASVDSPRPASAWLLVAVAGATLWITEQLDPWTVAVQAAAIVFSLARRTRPHPWQRSPIALNVGMFGIVAVTIDVAFRGGPSTIALAHFAALTQGLQLLDARPRRTEYLLVALALFQVVLAANLTDSVLFTPLLLAFLLSAVWTLIVHTLHSEAIEAGETRAIDRALTPGLLRLTVLASLGAALLALVMFVALPRLRSSVVTAGAGSVSIATAGFSDTVALGDLGRIRQDSTIVMRVETLEGELPEHGDRYWRGLAFDHFDGTSWSITSPQRSLVAGSVESGITLGRHPDRTNLSQRIVREPVSAGVLFGLGVPGRLQGTVRRLERDRNGGLYAAGQSDERVRYTIATRATAHGDPALRRDTAQPPRRGGDRYLHLPELSDAVGELAREITRDADTDADRMRALERYLLENGSYSDTPPAIDPGADESPVERFLFGGMAAHCEYFASALVVLARSVDIPTRMVNGFAGGRRNRVGGFVELTRSDAHAWVEAHYERAGWVRYDATPADLRARPELALSLAVRMRELGSAVELWWFQSVVGFDRSDQVHAMKRAWLAWKGNPEEGVRTASRRRGASWRPGADLPVREALVLALCAAGAAGVVWRLLRRRRSTVHPAYAEALALLARRDLVRGAAATARDFERAVRAAQPGAVGDAFAEVSEAYLAERFGDRRSQRATRGLAGLRAALRLRD